MGAAQFETLSNIPDVKEAFSAAVEEARYMHGHGGYTGTIAEKHDFLVLSKKTFTRKEAQQEMERLFSEDDRIYGKGDPAGALHVVDDDVDGWLFFGWASE